MEDVQRDERMSEDDPEQDDEEEDEEDSDEQDDGGEGENKTRMEIDRPPPAATSVKTKSIAQAEQLAKHALVSQISGDLEKAVRMYLMAFKLDSSLIPSLLQEFKQALADHTSALTTSGRNAEAISLQNLATSILPGDAWALTSLGRLHFLDGNEIEAGRCWRSAVRHGGDCREAIESLDCLNSTIVNRWHYRMVNDAVRNSCYQTAISRALRGNQAGKKVLDIGCGTGLLSMYAAGWHHPDCAVSYGG